MILSWLRRKSKKPEERPQRPIERELEDVLSRLEQAVRT